MRGASVIVARLLARVQVHVEVRRGGAVASVLPEAGRARSSVSPVSDLPALERQTSLTLARCQCRLTTWVWT
jgi:hypothetical protein